MRADIYPSPADDPEAKKFTDALGLKPDPLHRMMFADWLQENGYDNAASGQRWAAKHKKEPLAYGGGHPHSDGSLSTNGGWFFNPSTRHEYSPHVLPWAFGSAVHRETHSYPHPVLTRSAHDGTAINENDFLDASHQLDWNPESGDPMNKREKAEYDEKNQ